MKSFSNDFTCALDRYTIAFTVAIGILACLYCLAGSTCTIRFKRSHSFSNKRFSSAPYAANIRRLPSSRAVHARHARWLAFAR